MTAIHTGGCQCGAVRFRLEGSGEPPSICHCRMCQKAFGNFYAPLVNVGRAGFAWTRGEPKRWRSSNHVRRGFCGNCGTPLTYEADDGLSIAIGAFDDPEAFQPVIAYGAEGRIGWVDQMAKLKTRHTMDDLETAPFLADITSFQHPDHDTLYWAPGKAEE